MTKEELDQKEREAFLEWRTSILELEKNEHLLLTPFERNLEMWRQLWRVVERSDLVVTVS
jgi:large subunit GTPase 1